MMSKMGLSPKEIGNSQSVLTSHDGGHGGWVNQRNREATVYVKYLDMFVTVQLLQDTQAVLFFGKNCEEIVFT